MSAKKRPDVAAKHQARKLLASSTVELTLNSFCKPYAQSIPFHKFVKVMSQVALEAKIFANLHILRLFELGISIPTIDQHFFYRCCSVVGSTARLSLLPPDMVASLEVYLSWRPLNSRPINTDKLAEGAINNLARTCITEFKNHLAANFFSKFKQYLRARHCLDASTAHATLQQIYGFSPAVPFGERGFNPLVHYWKEQLPAVPSKSALFANPALFLPLFHHFQKFLHRRDEFPELKQFKQFSLLPHKAGFKASFFRIDTNTLHGLLQVAGYEPPSLTFFRNHQDIFWRQLFHIDKLESGNRSFGYQVLTDGKAVAVYFEKPRPVQPDPFDEDDLSCSGYDYRRIEPFIHSSIWGLDPGQRDLFHAVNEEGDHVKCSGKEYSHLARHTESNKKIRGWYCRSGIQRVLNSVPTKRCHTVQDLEIYGRFVLDHADELLDFHIQKPFRDLRFKRYVSRQKAFNELCQRLKKAGGYSPLVGFGDYGSTSVSSVIKGHVRAPIKRLRACFRKAGIEAPYVDEAYSSQVCSRCHDKLSMMRRQALVKGRKRQIAVYEVLHCQNNVCSNTTVHRDVDAAKSILDIFLHAMRWGIRPPEYCHRGN